MNNINDTKPTVSVVMITYNHEAFIAEAIEGVLMQNADFPIELIIADDCSPDKTQEIVKSYIDTHPKGHWINYTRHSANKGMMPNFIWALNQAKGKYIALCEGDDYWTDPLKLQKQVDFLEENEEYVVSGHNAKIIDTNNNLINPSKLPEIYQKDASCEEMKKIYGILTLTMVFRNITEVRNFPITLLAASNGDSCLTSMLGNYGKYHYHQDIKPAAYRVHIGGIWSLLNQSNKYKKLTTTYSVLKKYYEQKSDAEMVKYFTQKITQNRIQQFDYSMNNDRLITKLKKYFSTLFIRNNLIHRKRFIYLNKAFLKSIISKK